MIAGVAMRKRAYAVSRTMTWERTAERYMAAFENARQGHWLKVIARADPDAIEPHSAAAPEMQIGHFLSMCDDTGLFQHAVHSVPDRSHGYCVDDNARALAAGLRAQQSGRAVPFGSLDGPLCRLRATCLESRDAGGFAIS